MRCFASGEAATFYRITTARVSHNLEPLFDALGAQTLKSVKARPELALDPMQQANSYVTEITFLSLQPASSGKRPKQGAKNGQLSLKPGGWDA
jgi:hypothetical protein